MKTLEITKGEWLIEESDLTIRSKNFGESDCMGDFRGNIISDLSRSLGVNPQDDLKWKDRYDMGIGGRQHAINEVKSNAILIADAGNTYQQCELLPSELLKQNKELRAAVNHSISTFEKMIAEWGLNGTSKEFVIRLNIDFLKDALNSKP